MREALKRKRVEDDDAQRSTVPPPAPAATKSCVHEVALPASFAGDRAALLLPKYDGERAKSYPFVLDPFQETAIACLARQRAGLRWAAG